MLGKLTYAVLDKLLMSIGFSPKPVRQPWQAYHHRESDALILLRKRKPTANVPEPDILSIRRHLVEKGLIDENEFDQLLSEAAQGRVMPRSLQRIAATYQTLWDLLRTLGFSGRVG